MRLEQKNLKIKKEKKNPREMKERKEKENINKTERDDAKLERKKKKTQKDNSCQGNCRSVAVLEHWRLTSQATPG